MSVVGFVGMKKWTFHSEARAVSSICFSSVLCVHVKLDTSTWAFMMTSKSSSISRL